MLRAGSLLTSGLLLLSVLLLVSAARGESAGDADAPEVPAVARRVVSMNPSLSSILLALGARGSLVGVEEHAARLHPELRALPSVGGLFNPSLEAVLALEPDLVVLVPSAEQRGFRERLSAFDIEVLSLRNITRDEILDSIEQLGARVDRRAEAARRVTEIRAAWSAVERAAARRPRVRALVVLQRDPLFVVGRGSFIDEMLVAAGAENAAAEFSEPYPRAGMEWLIAKQPEVILDSSDDPSSPERFWSRWPSLPAVASGRTFAVRNESIAYPGPYIDRALRLLAETLHGADFLDPP